MTRTIIAPAGYTLGDGSTAAKVASSRWMAWRWYISIGMLALVVVTVLAGAEPPTSTRSLSVANHQPEGARALGEILGNQGVSVREVATLHEAYLALSAGGTLAIADYVFLSDEQIDSINAHDGDVVWIGPAANELHVLDQGLSRAVASASSVAEPGCASSAANRAESLTGVRGRIVYPSGYASTWQTCFSSDGGFSFAYLRQPKDADGEHTLHLLADKWFLSNEHLATDGNAALALNLLGSHKTLVWYIASPFDETTLSADQPGASYYEAIQPDWLTAMVIAATLTALLAGLWQGRRMGRLVDEPLPVVVRASEATRGRARLYRRGSARGHATAALRASAATRMAARLGLPRSSSADAVVAAIAGATGRDGSQVHAAVYGAVPQNDQQMIDLITMLDNLEGEVAQS
ncbi:MAG: hypothetical protein CVT64_09790 [Actinobacteria bacterium HGW-Actinobacteria-4]|nr:MAG: hypothetical protein CVT64_09790 [Actinobacteria bacterium HGW-Actinobacteria-4]